jgi:ABC-type xylose transport system permease subunit
VGNEDDIPLDDPLVDEEAWLTDVKAATRLAATMLFIIVLGCLAFTGSYFWLGSVGPPALIVFIAGLLLLWGLCYDWVRKGRS